MPFGSPFEAAVLEAGRKGSCPVWELEDFYTNHWDFETLYSEFRCRECVAEPEDLGPTEPWTPGADSSSDDIPF
jgi:hypothetical protein